MTALAMIFLVVGFMVLDGLGFWMIVRIVDRVDALETEIYVRNQGWRNASDEEMT